MAMSVENKGPPPKIRSARREDRLEAEVTYPDGTRDRETYREILEPRVKVPFGTGGQEIEVTYPGKVHPVRGGIESPPDLPAEPEPPAGTAGGGGIPAHSPSTSSSATAAKAFPFTSERATSLTNRAGTGARKRTVCLRAPLGHRPEASGSPQAVPSRLA